MKSIARGLVRDLVKPVSGRSENSLSSYWASLISATVEDADATKLILTFSKENTSLLSSDFALIGTSLTILSLSRDVTNKIFIFTLSGSVVYGDVFTVSLKGLTPFSVTNNMKYTMLLTSTGTGAGVSTLRFQVSSDITITLGANAKFYTNSAGTLGESDTWNVAAGALRTMYLKCTTGTALMTFSDITKLTKWGDNSNIGWVSADNAAVITTAINMPNITHINISGKINITNDTLPSSLNTLVLNSIGNSRISWTSTKALPQNLIRLILYDASISYTHTGDLPSTLTYFLIWGTGINWTLTDVSFNDSMTWLDIDTTNSNISFSDLPSSLTNFYVLGSPNTTWTYSGALPSGLVVFKFTSGTMNWTYSGALPSTLTYLDLNSSVADWTSTDQLPAGLTYLSLIGNGFKWTYTGALPTNLAWLHLSGTGIAWTYNGNIPAGVTHFVLDGNNIAWTYNDALPSGVNYLYLVGTSLNWSHSGAFINSGFVWINSSGVNYTGDFAGTGAFSSFRIYDFRSSKMDDTAMETLITNLTGRVGNFPASIYIGDYTNAGSPPAAVTNAINTLKSTKSITNVYLYN